LLATGHENERERYNMMVIREVFQAKYGKGDELVALCKEESAMWADVTGCPTRLLTDASGTFFTVIWETEVESLGKWEEELAKTFERADFTAWFERMVPLVDSGRRDFYTVVV
jgi:hypothetical protein